MAKAVLLQGKRQSNMIRVNDLFFVKQNINKNSLENIALKLTVHAREIHFFLATINTFLLVVRALLIFSVC